MIRSESEIDPNVGEEEIEVYEEALDYQETPVEVGIAGRVPDNKDEAVDREKDEFDNEFQMCY